MTKMTDAELLNFLDAEADQSRELSDIAAADRVKAVNAYNRQPYGNEEEGRSAVVASDVFDAVEGMLPDLIEVFTSSDKAVAFEPVGPEDEESAEQVTNACNYVFYKQNPGFLVLYDAFKNALLQKTGAVKWYWEEKRQVTFSTYKGVTEDQIAQYLLENPDTQVVSKEEIQTPTGPAYNVRAKKVGKSGACRVLAMPPGELRVSAHHDSILLDECPYVAHVTRKTLSDILDMGYDVSAADVRAAANDDDSWRDYETRNDPEDNPNDESQTRGWLRDEYVLVDYDGDGIAERRRVVRLGGLILENVDFSHVPIAAWSPYLLPHQFTGISVADLVEDFQRIHTTIQRQQLDNLALANNQETVVLVDAQGNPKADIDDLLNRRPGGIIRAKEAGAVQPYMQRWQGIEANPMLEQLQMEKENRTGWTRYSQGLDGDSLNKTATGAQMIMNASQKRMKLMARIAAECLVAPMFRGIFKTLSDYGMERISYRLNGKFVAYDPQEWRDQYDMTINVGIGTGDVQQQSQFLMQIMQAQAQVGATPFGPKLLNPKVVYNVQARLAENAGFKNPAEFWVDPDTVPPAPPGPPEPSPLEKVEMAKLQDNQQRAAAEMAQKARQAELDREFKAQQAELDRLHAMRMEELKAHHGERCKAMDHMASAGAQIGFDDEGGVSAGPSNEQMMLASMQQTLEMLAQSIAAPKRVVRDENGQAIGVVPEFGVSN